MCESLHIINSIPTGTRSLGISARCISYDASACWWQMYCGIHAIRRPPSLKWETEINWWFSNIYFKSESPLLFQKKTSCIVLLPLITFCFMLQGAAHWTGKKKTVKIPKQTDMLGHVFSLIFQRKRKCMQESSKHILHYSILCCTIFYYTIRPPLPPDRVSL